MTVVDRAVGAIHSDTMREPAIHNHTTGSQRALEVRASLSRFRKKRVRIPRVNARVARFGDIYRLRNHTVNFNGRY